MAEESFWKWKDFQLSRACGLNLEWGHTAYRRASLIDLNLYCKFHWNQRNFVDRRTYVPTYGHLRPSLLRRLRRVDLDRITSNVCWQLITKLRESRSLFHAFNSSSESSTLTAALSNCATSTTLCITSSRSSVPITSSTVPSTSISPEQLQLADRTISWQLLTWTVSSLPHWPQI